MKYSNILIACKKFSRLCYRDYGDASSYRADAYMIRKQKERVLRRFGFISPDTEIVIEDNRIEIGVNTIDYTACQYAPTEIWCALYNALDRFYKQGV